MRDIKFKNTIALCVTKCCQHVVIYSRSDLNLNIKSAIKQVVTFKYKLFCLLIAKRIKDKNDIAEQLYPMNVLEFSFNIVPQFVQKIVIMTFHLL